MARRSGFEGFLRAAARSAAAAQRERNRQIRAQLVEQRQIERQQRMARVQQDRDLRLVEKLAKQQYLEDRAAEAADQTAEIQLRIEQLADILAHTLRKDDTIGFDSLRLSEAFPAFVPPPELAPERPPRPKQVPAPSGFAKFLPGATAKYQKAVAEAAAKDADRLAAFQKAEQAKRAQFAQLRKEHEEAEQRHRADVARRNAEIDAFRAAYLAKEPDAVVAYSEMVLARSEYPTEGFPQRFRVAYSPESAELVIEYDLPEVSVVPDESEFKYTKSKDLIEARQRKPAEIKQLYQDVIAAIVLRTIHEVCEADQAGAIAVATFNGIVETVDPSTGKQVRVPIVSVRTPKADFLELKLDRVDKRACLKNLGAQVSNRPEELQAIKPIVEFDMVDKRFVEQSDVLSGLDARPNLLDLSPGEFETLVANLFGRMGLETKLTRASKDGGVDAVAFDSRPVLGGRVVIQAKRYRDTVGVSAVRDLYGTMLNEGANKGILVCTSGYGPDAFNFTKDKPIELIDGGGLLYLLREHAGMQARIAR